MSGAGGDGESVRPRAAAGGMHGAVAAAVDDDEVVRARSRVPAVGYPHAQAVETVASAAWPDRVRGLRVRMFSSAAIMRTSPRSG